MFTRPKVSFLGPPHFAAAVAEELGPDFWVTPVASTRESFLVEAADATVILDASMKLPLEAPLLANIPGLRLVITATTGADHIDQEHLKSRGIPLLTLKGQREILEQLTPAAELSWLLLMACARRLRPALQHVENGLWDREQFPGLMLKGKTLGLIGCGRIGRWMARYGRGFDLRVVGCDPYADPWPDGIERCALPELLSAAHFISIHVHLSPETRGLLGAQELAMVQPGAVLVNTSRGAIVDESALLAALETGQLGAYGADVLEGEPDIRQSRLWQFAQTHDNVVITPHIGGFSPDAVQLVLRFTAGRIRQFFSQPA